MASVILGQSTYSVNDTVRTLPLTATPTPGKRILLGVTVTNSGTTTITDSKGNTWTQNASQLNVGGPSPTISMYAYSCLPTTPLVAGDTLTITHGQTGTYALVTLIEPPHYLGPLDDGGSSGSGSSAGGTTLSATVSPVTAGDETIVWASWGGAASSITSPSGFTQVGTPLNANASRNLAAFGGILTNSGSQTLSMTIPSAQVWGVMALSYPVVSAPTTGDTGSTAGGGTYVHAWTGIPTGTSCPVKTKTSGATQVNLKIATDSALTQNITYSAVATPDTAGYALHTITGLTAGTTYYYDTIVGGTAAGKVGSFTTAAQFGTPFKVAFGSCLESNSTVATAFNNAMGKNPSLFLHLGDWHYEDTNTNNVTDHRAAIEMQITKNAGLSKIIRTVPTAYLKSDHDAGGNNVSGLPQSFTTYVNQAYKQVVPNAPLLSDNTANYWSFVYNGVRFIMLDTRSFHALDSAADSSSHSMIGATQKTWLKSELLKPEILKVICSDVPWISNTALSNSGDSWGGFATERKEIGDYVVANKVNAVIIHGDSHSLIGDDGSHSVGNIPVFGAAPFDKTASVKGGPSWTSGPWPSSGYTTNSDGTKGSGPQSQMFGLMTFTPSSTSGTDTITVAFNGYGTDNVSHVAVSKTFSSSTTGGDPGGGGGGGGTPTPPVPVPGQLTISYDGSGFTPSGGDTKVTSSALTAMGGAVIDTYASSYVSAPVLQVQSTPAKSLAAAITSSAGFQFTISKTGTWTPSQLRFKVAKGGATDTRGVSVRSSADNFTSDLFTNTSVTSVRPTFETRTVDLTSFGQISGNLTFRFYCFVGSTNTSETIEFDDIEVDLKYDTSTAPPAVFTPDSWNGSSAAVWTTADPSGGASFSLSGTGGTASITLPATPSHLQNDTARTAAIAYQNISSDFDVAVPVLSSLAAPVSGIRGVGIGAYDDTLGKFVNIELASLASSGPFYSFAYASSSTVRTQYVSTSFTPSSPVWMRLKKVGNIFYAYTSLDGTAWQQIGKQQITFTPTKLGIYAVSSASAYTATFGEVSSVGSAVAVGVNVRWSLYQGTGLAERPLSLEGIWQGTKTSPITFDRLYAADVISPQIISTTSGSITDKSATITVTTDEPSSISVHYGPVESNFPYVQATSTYTTTSTLVLPNLTAATAYAGQVVATDTVGNSSLLALPQFTTSGGDVTNPTPTPTAGPQIASGPTITATDTTASIVFTTDVPSARKLLYRATGTTTWTTNTRAAAPGTDHTINLPGLVANTSYDGQIFLATTTTGLDTATAIPFTFRTQASTTPTPDPGSGGGSTGGGTPNVTVDRSMYPNGTGIWSHMPHYNTWKKIDHDFAANPTLKLADNDCVIVRAINKRLNGTVSPSVTGGQGVILTNFHYKRTHGTLEAVTGNVYSYDGSSGPFNKALKPGKIWINTTKDPQLVYGGGSTKFLAIDRSNNSYDGNRTFFALEGAYAEKGDDGQSWFWELLNYRRQVDDMKDVFVMQNCRFDGVNIVGYNAGQNHAGGDVFQPIGGPWETYIMSVTAHDSYYQGFFLQQTSTDTSKSGKTVLFPPNVFSCKNVNLVGLAKHSQLYAYKAGGKGTTKFTFSNVYCGSQDGQVSAASTIEDIGQPYAKVTFGLTNDFAPPGTKLGINYVSGL